MNRLNLIFIVDDDPIHQQIAKIMIDRQGISHDMRTFSDAQEVLDYLQGYAGHGEPLPDVILLDLNMPVIDGWDFLEAYAVFQAALPASIRIYVLTSSIDENDRERVRAYPFVKGYLTKPLTRDVILQLAE